MGVQLNHTDPAPGPAPEAAGLSDAQLKAVNEAGAGRKKIDVAIHVASFNAYSLAVFAVLSGLVLLFSFSLIGLFITAGLGLTAYHEFKGRSWLKELDTRAPKYLCYNQLALGGVVIVYCAWNMIAALIGPGTYDEVIARNPELADMLGSTGGLITMITLAVYGTVIVLTIPYQGAVAWFYASREQHLRQYLEQTPVWVTQVQRAAA